MTVLSVSTVFPLRFQDISNIPPVPDHQEVFADPNRDESLIFELLDLKHDVEDNGSAIWFLRDLAAEQDAEGSLVLEHSGMADVEGLRYRDIHIVITTAVGQMSISKGRQGREAQNIVRVYLANIRLKEVGTDVLITAYEPLLINSMSIYELARKPTLEPSEVHPKQVKCIAPNPLSESARTVGYGPAVPARENGCLPVADAFHFAVSNFKVHDWNLLVQGPDVRAISSMHYNRSATFPFGCA